MLATRGPCCGRAQTGRSGVESRTRAPRQLLLLAPPEALQPPLALAAAPHDAAAAGRRRRFARLRFLALRNLAPLLGDTRAALDAACGAAAADPSDHELWAAICGLAARAGDLGLARAAAERAASLRPRASAHAERRVLLLGACGDWAGALAALEAVGRAEPGHPWW